MISNFQEPACKTMGGTCEGVNECINGAPGNMVVKGKLHIFWFSETNSGNRHVYLRISLIPLILKIRKLKDYSLQGNVSVNNLMGQMPNFAV